MFNETDLQDLCPLLWVFKKILPGHHMKFFAKRKNCKIAKSVKISDSNNLNILKWGVTYKAKLR